MYADDVVSKFRFLKSFFLSTSLQTHSQQKLGRSVRSLYQWMQVQIFHLQSEYQLFCQTPWLWYTFICVFSCLNHGVHVFNSIADERVKTRFQIVNCWRLSIILKLFRLKTRVFPLWHFFALMGRINPKLQPLNEPIDSLAPLKSL